MMFRLLALLLLSGPCWAANSAVVHSELRELDVATLDPAQSAQLKSAPDVLWWLQFGDRLLLKLPTGAASTLPGKSLQAVDDASLAIHLQIHCGGDEAVDSHPGVRVLYQHRGIQLVSLDAVARERFRHDRRFRPFQPNSVLAFPVATKAARAPASDPAIAALVEQVSGERWHAAVAELAGFDRMGTATSGPATATGYARAADWLHQQFSALGLPVERQFVQANAENVIATQHGRDSQNWIVIGAHLDSRNRTFDSNLRSPGALDNASGCAGVLELARILSQQPSEYSIQYLCFAKEEYGLFGSKKHVDSLIQNGLHGRVRAMYNLDMIGYSASNRLEVELQSPDFPQLQTVINAAQAYTDLQLTVFNQTCCSDHMPYADSGIPALLVIDADWDLYPDYHRSSDLPDRLAGSLIGPQVLRMSVAALAKLAGIGTAASPVALGSHLNGYWYSPGSEGQGLQVEFLADAVVVATWYTFDAAGRPLWIAAQGSHDGNVATLRGVTGSDSTFPAPSAAPATLHDWGSLQLRFDSCEQGRLSWVGNDASAFPAGELTLSRLTSTQSGACAPPAALPGH